MVSRSPNEASCASAVASSSTWPAGIAGTSFDSMWYLRKIFENRHLSMKPGCGWLPDDCALLAFNYRSLGGSSGWPSASASSRPAR